MYTEKTVIKKLTKKMVIKMYTEKIVIKMCMEKMAIKMYTRKVYSNSDQSFNNVTGI